MNKGKIIIVAVAVAAIATAVFWNRIGVDSPQAGLSANNGSVTQVVIPSTFSETAKMGERAFNAICATCHGQNGAGTKAGPPLVHRTYEPSHHGDYAFEMAVANGVRAHHWNFGNMPPQPALTKADTATIITYVRELQRANGIN